MKSPPTTKYQVIFSPLFSESHLKSFINGFTSSLYTPGAAGAFIGISMVVESEGAIAVLPSLSSMRSFDESKKFSPVVGAMTPRTSFCSISSSKYHFDLPVFLMVRLKVFSSPGSR